MTKNAPRKRAAKTKEAVPASAEMEKIMRHLAGLIEDEAGIVTKDDLKALLTSLAGSSPTDGLSDSEADAKDEAQQIAFDAMEAPSEPQARKLAKRALKLDPDCVDALLVMIDLDARIPRETIEGLQEAVAAGERSLGAKFIDRNEGRFWLLIETRPYMRALETLAEAYRSQGISRDAIRIYERMLRLNLNDNQGARDPLLGLYLETGDLNGAALLLKKYKDDGSANFAWARVLERFLAEDRMGADAALTRARKANRHMELYLTAQKPLPEEPPEMYSPGSEEEAVLCLSYLSGAWAEHKDATFWLFDRLAGAEAGAVPSKAALSKLPVAGKRAQ
jgi:tetratricopeptide (TPR) repeat protein